MNRVVHKDKRYGHACALIIHSIEDGDRILYQYQVTNAWGGKTIKHSHYYEDIMDCTIAGVTYIIESEKTRKALGQITSKHRKARYVEGDSILLPR